MQLVLHWPCPVLYNHNLWLFAVFGQTRLLDSLTILRHFSKHGEFGDIRMLLVCCANVTYGKMHTFLSCVELRAIFV